jgi:ATP-dependent RNA helicase DDX51/DBP6
MSRYLVIDEADRVMEDVQNDWLTHVENAVFAPDSGRTPPGQLNVQTSNQPDNIPLQKLLFSATLSKDPEILQQLNLYEPKMFTTSVNPDSILAKNLSSNPEFATPLELKELFVKCDDPQLKPLLLQHLLVSKSMKKVLIFTKSGDSSHSLAVLLKQFGLSADELSSKVSTM